MSDLKDSIDGLHELDKIRNTAIELREQGLRSLRMITKTSREPATDSLFEDESKDDLTKKFSGKWTSSGSKSEIALLVKIQSHYHLNHNEAVEVTYKSPLLKNLTGTLMLEDLHPVDSSEQNELVPVLLAARVLSTLAVIPETVFSTTSMLCYYRIVRELYYADYPDWTIGGARAGEGGRASAFITGECIRAIMALEAAVRRTADHLRELLRFYDKHSQLSRMLKVTGGIKSLNDWASHAFEGMWLDWYISTHRRNGAISLDTGTGPPTINLEHFEALKPMKDRDANFRSLLSLFKKSLDREAREIKKAITAVNRQRTKEVAERAELKQRTESAHLKAWNVLKKVKQNALNVLEILSNASQNGSARDYLVPLYESYRSFPAEIHRVLEPAISYVDSVLDRELSLAHAKRPFDPGELVFAATAYGGVTKWQDSEKLRRACEHLVSVLPEDGRLTTSHAYHADKRGYKRFPIACEMTRAFAKLMHRTGYEFHPSVARRMIQVFLNDKQFFRSSHESADERCAGWNFENAPDFEKPCVWVTAITVQALDRVVRMLNSRINEEVFQHFKVVKPGSPEAGRLTLNELVYPDHGIVKNYTKESIANRLELMRAHIMRVRLDDTRSRIGSAIFYGPPGTGKTALLGALGSSARVPLVMLSPSDLFVQGQEQLESRARVVFDALSMLSQTVILLDEFEPVLLDRDPEDDNARQADPFFKFLVTGMLPKLKTLHEAGEKHSVVYCLATNHLVEIDSAAKRPGRFDILQPVYEPDPLSRAGSFLFALNEKPGRERVIHHAQEQERIARIVAATAFTNAGDLDEKFRLKENGTNVYIEFFETEEHVEIIEERIKEAKKHLQSLRNKDRKLESNERKIRETLLQFEETVFESVKNGQFHLDKILTVPEI